MQSAGSLIFCSPPPSFTDEKLRSDGYTVTLRGTGGLHISSFLGMSLVDTPFFKRLNNFSVVEMSSYQTRKMSSTFNVMHLWWHETECSQFGEIELPVQKWIVQEAFRWREDLNSVCAGHFTQASLSPGLQAEGSISISHLFRGDSWTSN